MPARLADRVVHRNDKVALDHRVSRCLGRDKPSTNLKHNGKSSMQTFPNTLRNNASELLLKCLNGIESFHEHIVRVHKDNPTSFNPTILQQEPVEKYIAQVLQLLYGIYAAKFAELSEGIIESTSNPRYLVFAYCCRGFIETTAALRFYNKKTQQLFMKAKNQDAYDSAELREIASLLDLHSRGGRFDWAQYWTLGRKGMVNHISTSAREKKPAQNPPGSNPSQINAKTMIAAWVSDEPTIALIYGFFCEVVHPNLGSNFLVMGADSGSLYVDASRERTIGRSLALEGIELVTPVVREANRCMAQLLLWSAMTEKATSDGAR